MNQIKIINGSTKTEVDNRKFVVDQLKSTQIPDDELLYNLGLFMNRQSLSRIIFMYELYSKIINVHGVIMEFGVSWGQNMALYQSFRGMLEPFNHNRKIIGFDTFDGFPSVSDKDGVLVSEGDYKVSEGHKDLLERLLIYHESESPIAHKRKFELVQGDASVTISDYLNSHPETIIALAYFDFDLYKPTKACLEAILPRITRGAILVFDELNCSEFPGETLAVLEVLGLSNYSFRRSPLNPTISYIIFE
jgi:hypothetical protein